jgi:hypothetical protein
VTTILSTCPYYYKILFPSPVHNVSLYTSCLSNCLILN